jgi:hypothetical protein
MNTYLAILGTIGVAIFGIAQWRAGKLSGKGLNAQTAADTVALLQASVTAFKGELAEAKKEIASQHDEIIRLQEANKHKDDQIAQYLAIIANRNPDLEKTIGEVRNFLAALHEKLGGGATISVAP